MILKLESERSFTSVAKDYDMLVNTIIRLLNSFEKAYANGFTEGCNNKIKVLKFNAYGYRNFNRFRNRILHMFAYKTRLANNNVE